jgi:hypothetical protein
VTTESQLSASFRDPSGFLFRQNGVLYRQVNRCYAEEYDALVSSGLFEELCAQELLIPHRPVDVPSPVPEQAYAIIQPDQLPFVSYPYEWCYSQLKDAAQTTLTIMLQALDHGFILKDASAYNIQFRDGRPLLIDTLSFERYREGEAWVAYRQFCQHFLAPLALMTLVDVRLGQLSRLYIDGVPLDLTSKLLPFRSRLRFSLLTHIHLHAKSQQRFADQAVDLSQTRRLTAFSLRALIDNLQAAVASLNWAPGDTNWAGYYSFTNYDQAAFAHKRDTVSRLLDQAAPTTLWDLGANTALFSQVASDKGIETIAFDIDSSAVEAAYRHVRRDKLHHLLPLLSDLTNPSPAQGWAHEERESLAQRGPADAVMALALVHHLAIGNNVPLPRIAAYFARLGRRLIIEFVPKSDSQVAKLLATRQDIFADYDQEGFEAAFAREYAIVDKVPIRDSQRTIYLMESRQA